MGRPRATVAPVIYNTKLTLTPGEDDDLIGWFEAISPRLRARAIVVALRQGGMVTAVDLGDGDDEGMAEALNGLFF